MTNLTEQDLRRIETIEGYLRQLDMCNPEYSLPQFKPYQPIDTTEGEQEQGKEWKPTHEEIKAHLVAIAKKKYPVGTKFKDGNDKQFEISETEFDYDNRENALFGRCYEFSGWVRIWDNGKWAETIAPIETEQRWKPEKGQLYYYVNWSQKDKIGSFTWVSDETDADFYELGNCFKTEQEAQKVAEAIKQYLSTNKF
jgi:hypothetical protein